MVMWIVLGSLIGVVVIFLVVTSTLDRKKSKKIKIEKELLSEEITEAGTIVSKEVIKIIKMNEKSIKEFVPSVGEVKMSNINKVARENLKEIQHSKNFKLLKHNTDRYNSFANHMDALIAEKSNNWSKRNKEDLKFFLNFKETDFQPKVSKVEEPKDTGSKKSTSTKVKVKKSTSKKTKKLEIVNPVSKKKVAPKGKK